MLFQEFTVAFVVRIELVIRDDRPVLSNAFLDVASIPMVLLPGLFPVGRIRIRWVLKHSGVHSSIRLYSQSALPVFHDSLLRQTSDKKLEFRDFLKRTAAFFQEKIRIRKQNGKSFLYVNVAAMIDDLIEVIRIIVMSHMSDQIISSGFVEKGYQF